MESSPPPGYRYETALRRTGADHEVGLDMTITPLGAIARLEHALSNFHGERDGQRSRLGDAERRLASYQARIGEAFAFSAELAMKRDQLAEIERALVEEPGKAPAAPAIAA